MAFQERVVYIGISSITILFPISKTEQRRVLVTDAAAAGFCRYLRCLHWPKIQIEDQAKVIVNPIVLGLAKLL